MTAHLPLSRYAVILRSVARQPVGEATKNLGQQLWQSPPRVQILRFAQNDMAGGHP